MATSFLPRKLIPKHDNISNHEPCTPPMQFLLPRVTLLPSPPPPPPSSSHDFSPLFTIMFGGLVITLCFICYLTCASRYRRRRTSHRIIDHVTREDFVNEGIGPMITLHPIWLINTPGLDQSQIESIQVFKYKRDEKLIEGTDCSVCLSEFEDDESLRLLPKCSHAFHVPCIDTWLRSHKNCPLCRAPIFNNTNDQTERGIVQSNLVESSTSGTNETQVNDSETIDDHDHDHHAVEVENSEEIAKNDLGDHQHVQGDHELVAMRRSCSSTQFVVPKKPSGMTKSEHKHKGSSSSINVCRKVTKSSSLGRSLRKASSFTSKCSPYNQSY